MLTTEPEAQPEPDQSNDQKETSLTAAAATAGTTEDADASADVDLEALAEEQAQLMARFNMADKDDLITLEQYMQDPQMDEAEVLPDDDTDEDVDGIKALYYPNAADVPQEDASEVVGDDDTSNESTAVTSDEQTLDSTSYPKPATSSTAGDAKEKTENTAPTDENVTDDSLVDDNEDELYDDVIEEQSALQEQYSMADKEDMIELEGLMQDDSGIHSSQSLSKAEIPHERKLVSRYWKALQCGKSIKCPCFTLASVVIIAAYSRPIHVK